MIEYPKSASNALNNARVFVWLSIKVHSESADKTLKQLKMGYAVMDINKITGPRPTNTSPNASKNSTGSSSSGVSGEQSALNSSGVSVKLTDAAATLLQSTKEALQQEPDVDLNKVTTLKDAISTGQYHIDASRVAAKLIKMEPDL